MNLQNLYFQRQDGPVGETYKKRQSQYSRTHIETISTGTMHNGTCDTFTKERGQSLCCSTMGKIRGVLFNSFRLQQTLMLPCANTVPKAGVTAQIETNTLGTSTPGRVRSKGQSCEAEVCPPCASSACHVLAFCSQRVRETSGRAPLKVIKRTMLIFNGKNPQLCRTVSCPKQCSPSMS